MSLSSTQFLVTFFPVIYQSLSIWPVSPAIIPNSFNSHATIHFTKWPLILQVFMSISFLYSESSIPVPMPWVLPSPTTPPPTESLRQTPLHTTPSLFPQLLPQTMLQPHQASSSLLQLQSRRALTFCCPDFLSCVAEPTVQQFYNASTSTLYSLALSAFLFPLSGKTTPLMNPTIYIPLPAAESF